MNKNRILNIMLVISGVICILISYFSFCKKEHPIKDYLDPEDLRLIYKKEHFGRNFKIYFSIPKEEKLKIWKSFYDFLTLKDEEKITYLQNYIDFLKYDREKRERLKKIYEEFLEDM